MNENQVDLNKCAKAVKWTLVNRTQIDRRSFKEVDCDE